MTPEQAWTRLQAPDVTAAELAQIASEHPALRPYVASHPLAYPELLAWLAAWHDPATDAALAARQAAVPAAPSAPVPPPVPAAGQPWTGAIPAAPVVAPVDAAGATDAEARHRRLGTGAIAGIVAGALVVVGGVTAGAIALTHRGGSSAGSGAVVDMRTEPDELWTWQVGGEAATDVLLHSAAVVPDRSLAAVWAEADEWTAHLSSISLTDGAEQWSQDLDICETHYSGFHVFADASTVGYFMVDCPDAGRSAVVLRSAETGEEVSSADVDGSVAAAVLVDGSVVMLVTDADGSGSRVAAWPANALDGDPLWERDVDYDYAYGLCEIRPGLLGVTETSPSTYFARSCAATDHFVDLVDLSDGGASPVELSPGETVWPIGGDGYVVEDYDAGVWQIVDASGKELQSGEAADAEVLAFGGAVLAVTDEGYTVMRIDPRTGDELWDDEVELDPDTGALLGASSDAMTVTDGRTVTWYGWDTGKPLFETDLEVSYDCSALFGTGVWYVAGYCSGDRDTLLAYDASDGSELWDYRMPSDASVQPIDDRLFLVGVGEQPTVSLLGADR